MHLVGAFLPAATSFLWQSMHTPDCAAGLWNAACSFVFIGAVAVLVWQSEHFCCGAVAAFSAFAAWWQTSHLMPRSAECALCWNFTPPFGAGMTTVSGALASAKTNADVPTTKIRPNAIAIAFLCFTSPPSEVVAAESPGSPKLAGWGAVPRCMDAQR